MIHSNSNTERQSTEETLEMMRRDIEEYDSKEWYGIITLDELKTRYEAFKYVSETLNMNEMKLIALLRGCRLGDIQRFIRAAEKLFDAYGVCKKLSDITHINKK